MYVIYAIGYWISFDFNSTKRFILMPKWHGQFCLRPTKCVSISCCLSEILECDSFQVVLDQVARDDNITHLVEAIADVYSFVDEAEPLKKFETHKRILVQMAQQTMECGYFIRDYARNKNFGKFLPLHRIRP